MLALVAFLDYGIAKLGLLVAGIFYDPAGTAVVLNMDLNNLSLGGFLGAVFYYPAAIMGVPLQDAATVGGLMGTKLVVNEFVAYSQLAPMIDTGALQAKSVFIATFALCGFANFGSVAILIGGVGGMAPDRKHDLARLGLRAMICGTLASYLSATIAGILHVESTAGSNHSLVGPTVMIVLAVAVIIYYNLREKTAPDTRVSEN